MSGEKESEGESPGVSNGDRLAWTDTDLVQSWAKHLGVEPKALVEALQAVGPSISAARKFLGKA